jgi:ATP-dependent helicase/nuclease subunit A
MTNLLPDLSIRKEVLSPAESFHVESPAGAGKTSLLTARFIHLLAQVNDPREILALTFTNKAANEMQERVQTILHQAEKEIVSDSAWMNELLLVARKALKKHKTHQHLILASDGLQITTFHSFCNQIIKQAPVEAQVPLEAVILAEEEQDELILESLGRTQRTLMALPPKDPSRKALERVLLYFNNNWKALSSDLAQLTVQRDRLTDLLKVVRGHPDPAHLEQVLRERLGLLIGRKLESLKNLLESIDLGQNWTSFYQHLVLHGAAIAVQIPVQMPGGEWAALPAWQGIAELCTTKSGSARKQFGPKTGFYSGFKQTPWADYLESLPQPILERLHKIKSYPSPETSPVDVGLLFDLILLISQVVDHYRQLCQKRGVIDFVELEQAALKVLGSDEAPTDLQLILDQRINHILVDEFQDTSLNQWQLIQYLCAGWSPGDGRTLFIVGDPKQSIYGFRKAEVSLFMKARNGLPLPGQGLLPLKAVYISTNFRSRKELIDFTNDLFSKTIMAHPNLEVDEVSFLEAQPAPEMLTQDPGTIKLTLLSKEEDPTLSRLKEAAWLAGAVNQADQDPRSGSIGILLFARTHLPLYLKALYEQGLQVQVQEGLNLEDRPEVQDLFALTRSLVRPQDDLAWASMVRSAWCWLGLDDLLQISQLPMSSFAEKVMSFAQMPQAQQAVKTLGQVLGHYQNQTGRLPLHRVLQKIWEELSGPKQVAERYGLSGVRNCRQFLQLLFQAEKGLPEETLSHLEFLLASAYAPPDPLASRSKVTIMTVHHAKGLEFDTVFLPHLDRNPLEGSGREDLPYILERLPGEREEYLIGLKPDRRTKNDPGVLGMLKDLKKERGLGEAKRLYYVALTRAKKNLCLSGLYSGKEEVEKAPKHSLLGFLLNHPGKEKFLEIDYDPRLPEMVKGRVEPLVKEDVLPLPFVSEPVPYRIILPSGLHEEDLFPEEADQTENFLQEEFKGPYGMARGTVIHRILEHLGMGKGLPTEKAVVQALMAEGVGDEAGQEMADLILAEVCACQQEPFCANILRADHPFSACEWVLEDQVEVGTVRSGVIDRIIFDGKDWLVVDYKTTSLPEGIAVGTFFQEQDVLYRKQLLAYQEMLAHARSIDPALIRLFLYFTALQKEYEIK